MREWLTQLLLRLLVLVSQHEWMPMPEPAAHNIPQWVLDKFGSYEKLTSLVSWYSATNEIGVWRVTADKAPVFFSDPRQEYEVARFDGSMATKHVFSNRTSPEQALMIAVANGMDVLGYRKVIPTTTESMAKGYADGEPMIEICLPEGGAIRTKHAELVGAIKDGVWVDAEYDGL